MKKVIIVGGGIAGLAAGVYAQQSGFDTTIIEMHSIPGGNCTSWKRNGYLFEGGMHWLTGSRKDLALHKCWLEVGALNNDTPVHYRDPFTTFYYFGKTINLYRDLEKLKAHFLQISPEDEGAIDTLCNDIKAFQKLTMPIMDVKGVKVKQKSSLSMGSMFGMLPVLPKVRKLTNMMVTEYNAQFKSPALRAVLNNVTGSDTNAIAPIATLATLTHGDGGYPKGGSLQMAINMAKRYKELGGTIIYNSRVEKVIMENDHAKGVVINGEKTSADAVIITQDTLAAIDNLFDKPLNDPWMQEMRRNTRPMLNIFICFGVDEDLSDLPGSMMFFLEKPMTIGGVKIDSFGAYNYAGYEGYAPKGCTAMTSVIIGDSYDFWKSCKDNGSYEEEKCKVGDTMVRLFSENIAKLSGKITVLDVATPLTYERYCGTYKGSWMSNTQKGQKMTSYPIANDSLKNLYFAGQRMMSPGGLPVALDTGRKAVQHLCKDTGTVFQGQS